MTSKRRNTKSKRMSKQHMLSGSKETRINPFQCDEVMKPMDKVKFGLGVLLLPLKFLVIFVTLTVGTLLISLTIAGCDTSKPLPPVRGAIQRKISTIIGRALMACFGVYTIKFKGQRSSAKDCKMLVIAPHSTCMDALLVGACMGAPSGVGKAELKDSIVGPYMEASQTIFVDRENKSNKKKVAEEIAKRIAKTSKWQRQLAIFPEGTCTNRTSLISFRPGAFAPGEPVQPVVIHWEYDHFDPSWTAGALNRALIVFRSMAQVYQKVTVEFLPVYQPSEVEQNDAILFSKNVQRDMAAALHIPATDFTYPDMFLAQKSAKAKVYPAKILPFMFRELIQEIDANEEMKDSLYDDTTTLLLRFVKAPAMSKNARLSEKQFARIASKAASDIGLKQPLEWAIHLRPFASKDDACVDFHDFLVSHLNNKHKN